MKKFNISGMSCAACSARVERAVMHLDGVKSCAVNLLTNSMDVEGDVSDSVIISAVIEAGYGAEVAGDKKIKKGESSSSSRANAEIKKLRNRFLSSLGFLLVLMYIAMGHTMFNFPIPKFLAENHVYQGIAQIILCLVVMVINRAFFISGVKSAIKLAPNMDTLVALGSGASLIYSLYAFSRMVIAINSGNIEDSLHFKHEFYFESAAMILVLITLGKMLEAIAKGKTTSALDKLIDLAPSEAVVIRDGVEVKIPIEEVKIDDIFLVRPGESVAVDGIIVEGASALDESALTGESIPVDKGVGDSVYSATINRQGFLRCRATSSPDDTILSKIIKMVSDASSGKAPIAKIADKVSAVFVPVVIAIAIVTFIAWILLGKDLGFALTRGISVLVISCPCALGLATPVSIMVGSGVGAKNGILFKNATSLEESGKVNIVVLDKTGTITEGKPKVVDIVCENNIDKNEFLTLAYSLEKQSEHPLAHAIVEYGEQNNLTPLHTSSFMAVTGNGLLGEIEGSKIYGGNESFISQYANISQNIKKKADSLSQIGKTPMFFAKDSSLLGVIAVADTIKPDAKEAIGELHKMGISTIMLTGDNQKTAAAIAKEAGVDEFIAGVLPDGKESVVRSFREKGRVAMVGDGINDAPALVSADIGIAIGSGTDIAIDSADVVLIKSKLEDLPAAIKLSRSTLNNIKLSLFWAFFYNCLGIPLAAGAFVGLGITLNPMIGAAAMSISSFCVVCNALRLNFVNIYKKHNNKAKKENKPMEKIIRIEGMMCMHCEAHVKKALEALEGVELAEPSHTEKMCKVTLSKDVSNDTLKSTVEAQGYTVLGIE